MGHFGIGVDFHQWQLGLDGGELNHTVFSFDGLEHPRAVGLAGVVICKPCFLRNNDIVGQGVQLAIMPKLAAPVPRCGLIRQDFNNDFWIEQCILLIILKCGITLHNDDVRMGIKVGRYHFEPHAAIQHVVLTVFEAMA